MIFCTVLSCFLNSRCAQKGSEEVEEEVEEEKAEQPFSRQQRVSFQLYEGGQKDAGVNCKESSTPSTTC